MKKGTFTVKIETQGFPEVRKKLMQLKADAKPIITKSLVRGGHMIETTAKQKCAVKTGRLRSSITTETIKWDEVHIGTNVEYGSYVEYGTGPHFIEPKNTSVLKFEIGGEVIFAKRVYHPGTKPQPYLRPALHQHKAAIRDLVIATVEEVWQP